MKHSIDELTVRERQVAELLAWGASQKEVPDLLSQIDGKKPISVDTVRTITQNIYEKWEIQKVSELSAMWFCLHFHIPMNLCPFSKNLVVALFLALLTPSVVIQAGDMIRPGRTTVRSSRIRSGKRESIYQII